MSSLAFERKSNCKICLAFSSPSTGQKKNIQAFIRHFVEQKWEVKANDFIMCVFIFQTESPSIVQVGLKLTWRTRFILHIILLFMLQNVGVKKTSNYTLPSNNFKYLENLQNREVFPFLLLFLFGCQIWSEQPQSVFSNDVSHSGADTRHMLIHWRTTGGQPGLRIHSQLLR